MMRVLLFCGVMLGAQMGCTPVVVSPPFNTVGCDDDAPFAAWDFTMTTLEDETLTLSALRGRWVIINFWATWCVPCIAEMPVLQAIADASPDDLVVLGINQRETVDRVRDFVDTNGIRFPILVNPPDQVLVDYTVIGLPQTVIVDDAGFIVWRQFGPVALDAFVRQLHDLRAGS